MQYALQKLLKSYGLDDEIETRKTKLFQVLKSAKIRWIKSDHIWGMIGFQKTLFLNTKVFSVGKSEDEIKAKLIQTILHLFGDLIVISLTNDFNLTNYHSILM